MPSSHPELLHPLVSIMSQANPKTMLDVGCGYGKFGFLAREYLGLWTDGNGDKHKLETVDAIEAHEAYIGPLQREVYDTIMIGNICTLCDNIGDYDLILMVEVLEHLGAESGQRVLGVLKERAKALVVTTPKVVKDQGAEFGNDYEIHRSQWEPKDFAKANCTELIDDKNLSHYIALWY